MASSNFMIKVTGWWIEAYMLHNYYISHFSEVDGRVYWFHLVCLSICAKPWNNLRLSAHDGGAYCNFMLDNSGGGQL